MEVKVILDKEDYDQLIQESDQRANLLRDLGEEAVNLRADITTLRQKLATKPTVRVDDESKPWGDTGRTYNAGAVNVNWDHNGLWYNNGSEYRSYLGEGATLDPQ